MINHIPKSSTGELLHADHERVIAGQNEAFAVSVDTAAVSLDCGPDYQLKPTEY
jgi:hypothetical protein